MNEKILEKSWLSIKITLPIKVELSKSRQKKFYLYGSSQKVPKKYQTKRYRYLPYPCSKKNKTLNDSVLRTAYEKLYLTDMKTLERVVSNPRVAGKAKEITINSNVIYSGGGRFVRQKMVDEFKNTLKYQVITKTESIYPSHVFAWFKFPYPDGNWDVMNKTDIYSKMLLDWLQDTKVIPNDDSHHLHSNVASFKEDEFCEEGVIECILCIIDKKLSPC